MKTSHLKFLANYQYEKWANDVYVYYAFSDKFLKLVGLLRQPKWKATKIIKNSLIKDYPNQPEEVLELVAEQNLKELLRVFRKHEFSLAN